MQYKDDFFPKAVFISSIFHLLAFIFIFCTSFYFSSNLPQINNDMSFEVAIVSDINNIKPQKATNPKKSTEVKAKEVKKSTTPVKNQEVNKTITKTNNTKPAPAAPAPEKVVVKESAKPIPVEQKKVTEEKKVKRVEKEIEKPVDNSAKSDPLDSIFKNLEESIGDNDSQKIDVNSDKSDVKKEYFRSDRYNDKLPISVTEKNLIRRTIERNWHKPTSLPFENGIKILFEIEFDQSGKITNSKHLKTECKQNGNICKIAEQSVYRAIDQTKSVEGLPPKRYDLWKKVELHFDLELM